MGKKTSHLQIVATKVVIPHLVRKVVLPPDLASPRIVSPTPSDPLLDLMLT